MHHNRNERINQITETTLVIGIDIAKKTHFGCAIDVRGRELGKSFPIIQSLDGFKKFRRLIADLMATHGKTDVIVGFEPTGHYWMNLASYLADCGILTVFVNPLHVKRTKELDDNSQSKNDRKDARVIAKLIPPGYYSTPSSLSDTEQEIRRGSGFRQTLIVKHSSVLNRIRRWLDLHFPEFSSVYKGLGKQVCALLALAPLPEDLMVCTAEELVHTLKGRGLRCVPVKKVERVRQAAAQSIGIKGSTGMARLEIRALLDQLTMLDAQIDELDKELAALARQLPDFEFLLSIPGFSEQTVVGLLAETGSLTRFAHPRQLIKHAGLALTTHSSGKHEGDRQISRRGRKRLRALLYKATLPLLHANPPFRALYEYYISRRENPLKKKEALVVLCRKLLQICHGLCRHQRKFDAMRMMNDLPFLKDEQAAQAA